MSLVTTINFNDITKDLTGGHRDSEFTQNSNVTYNGTSVNTHRIRTSSTGSSTQITFNVDEDDFNNVLINNTDLIHLSFDVYVKDLNVATNGSWFDIAECTIDDDVVLYQKGNSSNITVKISVNYLIKSSRISNLRNNIGTLDILFKLYTSNGSSGIGSGDYIYIDREIKVYAIYKPEFSSITGTNRTISNLQLNTSYNASSQILSNANACEIKGLGSGTTSGNITFNLKNKLLNGKPISLFFNLNIKSFQNTDSLKIQVDNGSGTYVDYFEISQSANNNILKTFFYSQTENYTSSNNFNIRFNLSGSIDNSDYVYFENMFTYIPEAINFFDSDVSINGNIDVTELIYKTGVVGEIGMFYEESPAPPFGYLWCDGSQITTNSSTSGGDEKYRNLIEVLKGVNKNSTTGNQSVYLPDFSGCYALGSTNTFNSYENSATLNKSGTIDLDINYFPSHNHAINNVNYTNTNNNYVFNYNYKKTQAAVFDTYDSGNRNDGKSNQSGRSKNKFRAQNHNHTVTSDNNLMVSKSNAYLDANYNKTINNALTNNDINIGTSSSNTNVLVQPVSFQLKSAICYL